MSRSNRSRTKNGKKFDLNPGLPSWAKKKKKKKVRKSAMEVMNASRTDIEAARRVSSKNIPLKLKKPKPRIPKVGKKVSYKDPGVKRFPGETMKVLPMPTIYTQAEKEEMKRQEILREDYPSTAGKCMAVQPLNDAKFEGTYLQIDNSKLPLHLFDSSEYERHTPEEWVQLCQAGECRTFKDGEFTWTNVEVLGYDAEKQRYRVKFAGNHHVKHVQRLSLRFDKEDKAIFAARLAFCQDARERCKMAVRLEHYLRQFPVDYVQPIQKSWLGHIFSKSGFPTDIPRFEMRAHVKEITETYQFGMTKAVCYTGARNDPDLMAKYVEMRLPPIPPIYTKPPMYGKLQLPQNCVDFRSSRRVMVRYLPQARLKTLHALQWFRSLWFNSFVDEVFVDTTLEDISLPTKLSNFSKLQATQCADLFDVLGKAWHRSVSDHVTDLVMADDTYNMFETHMDQYNGSNIYKLLKHFTFRMCTQLTHIVENSCNQWVRFLESFVNNLAPVQESKDTHKQLDNQNSRQSLFDMKITVDKNNKVIFEPSPVKFEENLIETLNRIVSQACKVPTFEAHIMQLLSLEPRLLLDLESGNPVHQHTDELIKSARERVRKTLAAGMEAPTKLAALFSKYTYILDVDTNKIVATFMNSKPKPTHEQIVAKIKEFYDISTHLVPTICYDSESLGLFHMRTRELKDKLSKKAREVANAFMAQVVIITQKSCVTINESYVQIIERIAQKPANEMELMELITFVGTVDSVVEGLQAKVADMFKRMRSLYTFQYRVSQETFDQAWNTVSWPVKILERIGETNYDIENDKQRMLTELEREKDAFRDTMEMLRKRGKEFETLGTWDTMQSVVDRAYKLERELNEAQAKQRELLNREAVFGGGPAELLEEEDPLTKIVTHFKPYLQLWSMASDFLSKRDVWLTGSFLSLNGPEMQKDVMKWWTMSYKLKRSLERISPNASEVAGRLRDEVDEFKQNLPIVMSLASKALREWHWDQLIEGLSADSGGEIDLVPDEALTLQDLVDIEISEHWEFIETICLRAEKEFRLNMQLDAMIKEWDEDAFEFLQIKSGYVIKGTDDIATKLDDQIVKAQTMLGSAFCKGTFKKRVQKWEQKLVYSQDLLDEWLKCQRTWMYLEPIFGSEDIMRQMPTEGRRFKVVDRMWRKIISEARDAPSVMVVTANTSLCGKFKEANTMLDVIQKGLADYLEIKRLVFPRFYFLSNDELLEILSQTKDPRAVQPHLGKCFEGISKVRFNGEGNDLFIDQMIDSRGETVDMIETIYPQRGKNKGNVEEWLLLLQGIMRVSIKEIIMDALKTYPSTKRTDWILMYPAQVVLTIGSLYWTRETTAAIVGHDMPAYLERLNVQLQDIVNLVRGKLTKTQRTAMGALCVIDVHARDVVEHMTNINVDDKDDFEWTQQLRYYWEHHPDDYNRYGKEPMNIIPRICNAQVLYGYEYVGNQSRLVITPLTDRCYRTLMGAVALYYGGAPAGPAGTGKTETTKDLSKAVAIQCVVFNCSDGLDFRAMAKFFKGLAASGAWSCFDEFNRIELEVLSVIAEQLLTILKAKRIRAKRFMFEGSDLPLNPDCNSFITMNPGYAGRSELPDNLAALFRPCAMMVPDYAQIAEIKLYSFGFTDGRPLSRKLVQVLQLCSEQLSAQKHYDYGMRAVFSILIRAGFLRQTLGDKLSEPVIVLSAVVDVNLPKFTSNDIPLFKGITGDLFPGVVVPKADHGPLVPAILEKCTERKLQQHPAFVNAVVQLYETVMVRHGLMVVGEALCGKSHVIHTLAESMTSIKNHPDYVVTKIVSINPKAVTQGQLYGSFDPNTLEWADGILPVIYRRLAQEKPNPKFGVNDRNWVVFDGPVDAVWIENMNTVLDDNKKLCLTSGEIIKMSGTMTMMFETEDLEEASPATVSRVGMVFMEQKRLGWLPLLKSWCEDLPPELSEHLEAVQDAFHWLYPPAEYFVLRSCKLPGSVTFMETASSCLRLARIYLDHLVEMLPKLSGGRGKKSQNKIPRIIEGVITQAVIWSCGVVTDEPGRVKFNDFMKTFSQGNFPSHPSYKTFMKREKKSPNGWLKFNGEDIDEHKRLSQNMWADDDDVYNLKYDIASCKWINWMKGQGIYKIGKKASFRSILVPTIDVVRNTSIIQSLVLHGDNVMCTGDTGTAKTVVLKDIMNSQLDSEHWKTIFLNFSAQTSANMTQDIVDGKLSKRRKGVFGPPLGSKALIFVDDVNMPKKEIYGAQPPIEIMRQFLCQGGWYDRSDVSFRKLVDCQLVGAMGPPGGGRTQITQRFVRHFNLVNFISYDPESLGQIFGAILDWFLGPFPTALKQLAPNIIQATTVLYEFIKKELLPTPKKIHYLYNLRDLGKIFQGMSNASPVTLKEPEQLIRLWGHECIRVFRDRLINDFDREWYDTTLNTVTEKFFRRKWEQVRGENETLLYGNFLDPRAVKKLYQEFTDHAATQAVCEDQLLDYNAIKSTPMDLVLFLNAIEHVSRISRVINQPGGNCLLVGVGGSGRKSLTKLSVAMAEFEVFEIEISKVYGLTEWRDDLKSLFKKAGQEGKPTVFLFSDTQIKTESFVEDINNILNTGEVPNLFLREEITEIVDGVSAAAKANGVDDGNSSAVWDFFVSQCKSNLHIVLAFSPVGDSFRTRLLMFPSLVNCCTIDWFTEWPKQALDSVARNFLKAVDLGPKTKQGVIALCVSMQENVFKFSQDFLESDGRYFYVTPTSYLTLINTFTNLLDRKREEVSMAKRRYDNGLQKLAETEELVDTMSTELVALQPKLKVAQKETDDMLVKIKTMTTEANKTKAIVAEKEASTAAQAASANKIKTECEADLSVAIPTLNAAVAALNTLKKADITEVKNFKKPPGGVVLTLETVCIMFKVKPVMVKNPNGSGKVADYWGVAKKKVLSDSNFLRKLMKYDKDNISESIYVKVKKYAISDEFQPKRIAQQSKAAHGICKWVHAMVSYHEVAKVVAPKRAALKVATDKLNAAQEALKLVQAELQKVMDQLQQLNDDLQETLDKKNALETKVDTCARRLRTAKTLIKSLLGEKSRWSNKSAMLADRYENLVGDILLSSGMIAYMGPFTRLYRDNAIKLWSDELRSRDITCSESFSLAITLGDPVTIRDWNICKLPNDSFSVDNALMLFNSDAYPLMIDPEGQANQWVRRMEGKTVGDEKSTLKIVKQSENTFVRNIENAINFGTTILLENVPQELDPVLESVLLKQVTKAGGVQQIRVGDNTVEYDDNFRLYITTKLRNPHYPPETCVKVNLLNFMATVEGLEDQMLGIVVLKERPDKEAEREQLVLDDAANARELKNIEDTILRLLAENEGNILDNKELITTMAQSKVKSDLINEQVKIAARTSKSIAQIREGYKPVAVTVSRLFFCVADLSRVDPMYQYSLNFYIKLFNLAFLKATDTTTKSKLKQRIPDLVNTFIWILYQNVCRGLFEKDKLLFSFLLYTKIGVTAGTLTPSNLRFFLQGSTSLAASKPNPSKHGGWLPETAWMNLLTLAEMPGFEGFDTQFMAKLTQWKTVLDMAEPFQKITELMGEDRDFFERMMVLRSLRMDKVILAVQQYIKEGMGQKFIESPSLDLEVCYSESSCDSALVFVLSPGAAPMDSLLAIAEKMGFGGRKLFSVSMGQGQGPIAEEAITEAVDKGTWVCLQNCHLAASWMPSLEALCEQITPETTHPAFRLWLTSMPSKDFPVSILQNSIKMTSEPPKGMRANLLGSYGILSDNWFEECALPGALKKLCFALCFFHASLRERRKFGPLGWNIPYEFSDMDLMISKQQLRIFLDLAGDIDRIAYPALYYLAGECNYGGRVTDDKDRRCLNTILSDYYLSAIQNDDYKFSQSGVYYAPPEGNVESYLTYIRTLPLNEEPEVFELHENANITSAIFESSTLLSITLSLQPKDTGGGGLSWEEQLNSLASGIEARLPDLYDVELVKLKFEIKYSESMNTVLNQELQSYNRMLSVLKDSLVNLQKSISGEVVMSQELEACGNSMVNGAVPDIWHKAAYPSLKPLGSWVNDLMRRFEMFDNWIENGSPGVYWISGFYFTQAFLTGTRQNYARKYTIPIDEIVWDFAVLKQSRDPARTSKAEDGAYVNGFFLQGCGYNDDAQELCESEPKVLFIPMPILHIIPIQNVKFVKKHVYKCPSYKTSERRGMLSTTGHSTNFVVMAHLPINEKHSQAHWIKRGVAMLTQLDT